MAGCTEQPVFYCFLFGIIEILFLLMIFPGNIKKDCLLYLDIYTFVNVF
jgi:hypothetical protein